MEDNKEKQKKNVRIGKQRQNRKASLLNSISMKDKTLNLKAKEKEVCKASIRVHENSRKA
jgi:hypothetical protein